MACFLLALPEDVLPRCPVKDVTPDLSPECATLLERLMLAQAQKLLGKALTPLEQALEGREYLVGDFTAADIMLGHAIYQAGQLMGHSSPNLDAYRKRIAARPAFAKILAMR